MAGFLGSYTGSLDSKNRVHIPARLRQGNEQQLETCYLTVGVDGSLFLFPKNEWRKIEAKTENFNFGNPKANFMFRVLMANTIEVSPDRQGRILLPPELAAKAGIERDIMFIGMVRRIELWSPQKYDEYVANFGEKYDDVAAELFS